MSMIHLNKNGPKRRAGTATRVAALLLAIGAAALPATTSAAETEPSAKALEALTKAFAAQDAKDWAGAKALSEKQPSVVRDLVQWRYVSSEVSGATFDEIDAFVAAHANWPGRFQIMQRGEEALLTNALVDTEGPAWFKAHPPRTSGGCFLRAARILVNIWRLWFFIAVRLSLPRVFLWSFSQFQSRYRRRQ